MPPPLPVQGLVGSPVQRIGLAEMDAIVSPVPADVFAFAALRQKLQDIAWTQERIVEHQRVIESLLADQTVLPLKFCTLFSGRDPLVQAMARHRHALETAVTTIRGSLEWGVKMFCDRARLQAWIESHPDDPPSSAPSPPATAGTAFFQRKRQEQLLARKVDTALRAAAEDSHRRLSAIARAATANPPQAKAAQAAPTT